MTKRRWLVAVGAATLVGFVLRLIGAHESPAGDELYLYALIHNRSLGDTLNAVINQEKTPPLGFVFPWLTAHIGTPYTWMRAPSVIAGTALIPVTALLGRRTFGMAAGALAGAIIAISPFFVFYGIEARAYSMAALLVTGAAVLLLKATEPEGRSLDWAGFAGLLLAAMLTHYTTIFAVATLVVWAFIARPQARKALLFAVGAAGALFLVWLPSFVTQFGHAGDEARRIADQAPLAVSTLARMVSRASIGHPFVDLDALPGPIGITLFIAGFAIALVSALVQLVQRRSGNGQPPRPSATTWLIIALALTTLLGLIAASLQPHRSLLLTRNLMASLPAWAILAGALIASRPRPLAITSAALVLASLAIGTERELADFQRPPIGKAAEAVAKRWQPGEAILESAYATGPPLDQDLAIHLSASQRKDLLLTRNVGLKPFAEALKSGRPIFTVTPIAGYTTVALAPPPEIASRFERTWWKSWHGLVTVDAVEWTPRSIR